MAGRLSPSPSPPHRHRRRSRRVRPTRAKPLRDRSGPVRRLRMSRLTGPRIETGDVTDPSGAPTHGPSTAPRGAYHAQPAAAGTPPARHAPSRVPVAAAMPSAPCAARGDDAAPATRPMPARTEALAAAAVPPVQRDRGPHRAHVVLRRSGGPHGPGSRTVRVGAPGVDAAAHRCGAPGSAGRRNGRHSPVRLHRHTALHGGRSCR